MKYKRLPYEEFMKIYLKVPRAAVDVIIVSKNGFLLTKRAMPPFKGLWHIPGGTILFREPIKHAIDRIIDEELGVKVNIIKQLGIIEYLNNEGRHTVSIGHLATIKSGKLRGSEQGEDFKFFKKVPQKIIREQGEFINKHLSEIKIYWL